MVTARDVRQQLRRIGADYHFWGVAELRELPKILFDNEKIHHINNGRYSGGFATLCATDIRVLLIDKKPLFLTIEDIRYDMVSDVMFNHRLLNATLVLGTVHNSTTFVGFNKTRLRQMTSFIQERVMEYRRHQAMQQGAQVPAQFAEQAFVQPKPVEAAPSQVFEQAYEPQAIPTEPVAIAPVEAPLAATNVQASARLPINPYKMPITIRRRTSRFY